jgi:hypothetical protein
MDTQTSDPERRVDIEIGGRLRPQAIRAFALLRRAGVGCRWTGAEPWVRIRLCRPHPMAT